MLVKDFMSLNPITVNEEMSVLEAVQLLKKNNIRRLPVVRNNELVGIGGIAGASCWDMDLPVMRNNELVGMVTDRDVRSAGPSEVITFDRAERELLPDLYELLTKITIKNIMTKNVIVISPGKTIVTASLMMLKHKISGLPVVDSRGKLLGILTQTDIVKSFVDISASGIGKVLFGFRLEDQPGIMNEVAGVIKSHGGRIASIMSSRMNGDKQFRHVYIRIMDRPSVDLDAVKKDLEKYEMLFMIEDDVTIP